MQQKARALRELLWALDEGGYRLARCAVILVLRAVAASALAVRVGIEASRSF